MIFEFLDEQKNETASTIPRNSLTKLSPGFEMTTNKVEIDLSHCVNASHSSKIVGVISESSDTLRHSSNVNDGNSSFTLKQETNGTIEAKPHLNQSVESDEVEKQSIPNNCNDSSNTFSPSSQSSLKSSNQLSPRDCILKTSNNQISKRTIAKGGKPQWKGKPVIYDCDRSSRSPLPHSVPEGLDESLVFESRFESGNLRQVRRMYVLTFVFFLTIFVNIAVEMLNRMPLLFT